MKEKTYETIIEMLTEELELQKWRNEQLEEKNRNLKAVIDAMPPKGEQKCHASTAV